MPNGAVQLGQLMHVPLLESPPGPKVLAEPCVCLVSSWVSAGLERISLVFLLICTDQKVQWKNGAINHCKRSSSWLNSW